MTTTKTALYCEGCEDTTVPLNDKGYCPLCCEAACAGANGDAVGLPPQLPVDPFQARLALERASATSPFIRAMFRLARGCSECGKTVPQMGRSEMTLHVFGPRSTIMIGCEGYHTSLYRAAAKIMRGETV